MPLSLLLDIGLCLNEQYFVKQQSLPEIQCCFHPDDCRNGGLKRHLCSCTICLLSFKPCISMLINFFFFVKDISQGPLILLSHS